MVRLPLQARVEQSMSNSGISVPRAGTAGCRILLVDDNVDSAQTMATLLRMEGHDIDVVYDGETALLRAQATLPDAVLLDIGLPGMSGYQVARELRARPQTRHALLVAVTGYGQASDRQRALDAGFDHHLVKPVELTALEGLLATLKKTG